MSKALQSITEDMLRRYVELDEERKPHSQAADKLEREQKLIAKEIKGAFEADEAADVRRGKFKAELRAGPVYPNWKDEFVRALGAEAAIEVEKRTPPSKRLTVHRV